MRLSVLTIIATALSRASSKDSAATSCVAT